MTGRGETPIFPTPWMTQLSYGTRTYNLWHVVYELLRVARDGAVVAWQVRR